MERSLKGRICVVTGASGEIGEAARRIPAIIVENAGGNTAMSRPGMT